MEKQPEFLPGELALVGESDDVLLRQLEHFAELAEPWVEGVTQYVYMLTGEFMARHPEIAKAARLAMAADSMPGTARPSFQKLLVIALLQATKANENEH